jgi:putative endopeptidase
MDKTVHPGDDFFQYVNGTWLKNNSIPASESSWGWWSIIRNEINSRLKNLVTEASSGKPEPGSDAQKIGDFYKSGLDTATIESRGFTSIQEDLKKINDVKDVKGVVEMMIQMTKTGMMSLLLQHLQL